MILFQEKVIMIDDRAVSHERGVNPTKNQILVLE
jgi:hypothetical protein